MSNKYVAAPEHTAARVALWRALHVLIDSPPHTFSDVIGAQLVAEPNWMNRPDMNPDSRRACALQSLDARVLSRMSSRSKSTKVFFNTLSWERASIRLHNVGPIFRQGECKFSKLISPDHNSGSNKGSHSWGLTALKTSTSFRSIFERGQSRWKKLSDSGFNKTQPAVIVSTGVSMYLSKEANAATLCQIAGLAPRSTFAMTFMLALHLLEADERSIMEFVMKKAAESATPFLSLFAPQEITSAAKAAGFKDAQYVSAQDLFHRYFSQRAEAHSVPEMPKRF